MSLKWFLGFLLLGLYVVPILISLCLPDPRCGVPWHDGHDSANAPDYPLPDGEPKKLLYQGRKAAQ
jgi:hypothetical protein